MDVIIKMYKILYIPESRFLVGVSFISEIDAKEYISYLRVTSDNYIVKYSKNNILSSKNESYLFEPIFIS